jgi:hypothetical protein
MGLYLVRHTHADETCPARDPQMAPMLLQHLSEPNAKAAGVGIHGEAVIDGEHTLYLILDAADKDTVNSYMQPFAMAGEVEVLEASPCEAVVARGAC